MEFQTIMRHSGYRTIMLSGISLGFYKVTENGYIPQGSQKPVKTEEEVKVILLKAHVKDLQRKIDRAKEMIKQLEAE